MARYFGNVGYGVPAELVNGVWSDSVTELPYFGEILDDSRSLVPTDKVNDDIRLSNRISIVADAFALGNFHRIKYAIVDGVSWTVTTVKNERPRLILTLGGVYNGPRPTPEPPESP